MGTNKKGMQSYVDYLLDDIKQAEGNLEDTGFAVTSEADLFDHFMEVERLILDEPMSTIGQTCGLTVEQFPPEEKLTKTQIRKIVRAFYDLLDSWNLKVVIPKKFPEVDKYKLLVPLLDRKTHIIKNGTGYIELCSYEPKECPFGKHCDCVEDLDVKPKSLKKKKSGNPKSSTH